MTTALEHCKGNPLAEAYDSIECIIQESATAADAINKARQEIAIVDEELHLRTLPFHGRRPSRFPNVPDKELGEVKEVFTSFIAKTERRNVEPIPSEDLDTLARDTAMVCKGARVAIIGRWIWVKFPSKPDDDTRGWLKACKFRWNKTRGVWQFAGVPAKKSNENAATIAARYGVRRILADDEGGNGGQGNN
jgi:hypothetical protein